MGSAGRWVWWRGVYVVAGALALSACTVEDPGTPQRLPRVEHPRASVPSRGDERAVLAALRQVDACALLDTRAARVPAFPASARPVASGPHRCDVSGKGGVRVSVRLGMAFGTRDRLTDFYPRALGGAKAYVERWGNEPRSMCFLHLPVGRSLSVRFAAFAGTAPTDLCGATETFAATAARRLARPDTVRPGADRPMATRDPCAALGAALDARGYHLGHDGVGDFGIDGCVADPAEAPLSEAIRLTLGYGRVDNGGVPARIAGRPAVVRDGSGGCAVRWSSGTAGARGEQVQELTAPDCPRAERVAAAVAGAPAESPEAPRLTLLYGPDEPDLPVAGACGYYSADPARCRPYAEVPVPANRSDAIRAAVLDPHTNCALAALPALRPVVDDRLGCVFVEPTRTTRVAVRLMPGRVPAEPGATATTVAGLPTWTVERVDAGWRTRRLGVALPHSGTLSVTVYAAAPVGSTRDSPAGPARYDVADVAARIVTTYLS